jgi:hypothetical protein
MFKKIILLFLTILLTGCSDQYRNLKCYSDGKLILDDNVIYNSGGPHYTSLLTKQAYIILPESCVITTIPKPN